MTLAAARLTGATQHGALKFRDTMASAMTSGKIAEAQRLAQEWMPTSERWRSVSEKKMVHLTTSQHLTFR